MELSELTDRLDDRLRIDEYTAVDASPNGLQVGPDTATVEHVAVAVDAAQVTIDAAVDRGADLLVTHHGLIWGGLDRVTGRDYRRVRSLLVGSLPLYVAHLPLDGHQTLGNAAGIADTLELRDRQPFGLVEGEPVGQRGRLPDPVTADDLAGLLAAALDTGGQDVHTLAFGPAHIESVAIVTGAGGDFLDDAADAGVDALVTGEGKARLYHQARERGMTVVLAGHYATETHGIRAVGDLLADWGLQVSVIEHPTGL